MRWLPCYQMLSQWHSFKCNHEVNHSRRVAMQKRDAQRWCSPLQHIHCRANFGVSVWGTLQTYKRHLRGKQINEEGSATLRKFTRAVTCTFGDQVMVCTKGETFHPYQGDKTSDFFKQRPFLQTTKVTGETSRCHINVPEVYAEAINAKMTPLLNCDVHSLIYLQKRSKSFCHNGKLLQLTPLYFNLLLGWQ